MNTTSFIIQQTMFFAIPLLIVALGGLYSERSGISNIALEGIMILGAFSGVLVISEFNGVLSGQLLFLLAIAAAAATGGLYSVFHAWSSIRLRADQTISGTALNLFAPAFCIFTARSMYGVKQVNFVDTFFIDRVPVLADIPVLGSWFFTHCYISTYIGLLLLVVFAFILRRTTFGLRLSACGENPEAAASAGISVARMRYTGVILSGILGGAGGIIFVVPTSTNFAGNVAGYGFLALAVLILGQWRPYGILLAAFFFGVLKAIASSYSGIPALNALPIASEIYKMIPYILTILVLGISSHRSIAPKALGIAYDDGKGFNGGNPKKTRFLFCGILVLAVVMSTVMISRNANNHQKYEVSPGFGAEIALAVSATASVDDKSFTQEEWEGIVHFAQKSGKTIKYYQAKDNSNESLLESIDLAVLGNAKIVVLSNNDYTVAAYEAQKKYPEVSFIMADAAPCSKAGDTWIAPNTLCLQFNEGQSGFLAGYAAVMDGNRSLGCIGGVAIEPVVRYGYGFAAGAEYAAKELGLKPNSIQLIYTYAGTFSASPEILAMASSWYRQGTEVIFSFGGLVGNSVMKAAESFQKKVIGVDADQSGESETVITSAMKNVGGAVEYVLEDYMAGNFEGGDIEICSATENAVSLPMETSRFETFSSEQYQEIFEKLASGEIPIPSDTDFGSIQDIPFQMLNLRVVR